mgnify:CR=1 FL=1
MVLSKKKRFEKICKDIKKIKIQGARNVAKAALKAYYMYPSKKTKEKLLDLRPTEPMMQHVLDLAHNQGWGKKDILEHFDSAQEKINKAVYNLIKPGDIIFTHCHSTNVSGGLIYTKKHGRRFQVYNTETRPLYQGRKTAKKLRKAGIKVTMFVDSAVGVALDKSQGTKQVNKVFLGSDALLDKGIVNKIGSETIARIAEDENIPVYIVADSWKYSKKPVPMEQRELNEVWDNAPKNIKVKNPAFEFVPKKYIQGIISELGLQKYDNFLKKRKKLNKEQEPDKNSSGKCKKEKKASKESGEYYKEKPSKKSSSKEKQKVRDFHENSPKSKKSKKKTSKKKSSSRKSKKK